jgi:hypothetical protein
LNLIQQIKANTDFWRKRRTSLQKPRKLWISRNNYNAYWTTNYIIHKYITQNIHTKILFATHSTNNTCENCSNQHNDKTATVKTKNCNSLQVAFAVWERTEIILSQQQMLMVTVTHTQLITPDFKQKAKIEHQKLLAIENITNNI